MERFLNIAIKWPMYAASFILPILFLPWTSNTLDFNKQSALLLFVSLSLFAWLAKSLVSGRVKISFNPFLAFALLFAFIYSAAGFFSVYRYGSFWGTAGFISSGSITVIALAVFYFLVVSELRRREVFNMLCFFAASSALAMLFGALQLAGKFLLPFQFAKTADFNTIGSANSLAIFAAVLLPLAISLAYSAKRYLKWALVSLIVLAAIVLVLVNFKLAWLAAAAGSALIIVLGMQKRDLVGGNKLVAPMFFLAVALILIFFNFQIPVLSPRLPEVYLNQSTSFGIALNTLKEKPLFGSGPGTFGYDFAKFKDAGFNNTLYWNVRFETAGSRISNLLAEAGILGAISFLLLAAVFSFYGLLFALGIKEKTGMESAENGFKIVEIGAFTSFIVLLVSYFFYNLNLTADFYFFLLLACMSVFFYPEKKEVVLKTSSISTLVLTFVLMIFFIINLGVLISGTQRYVAEVYHFSALKQMSLGNVDSALADAERAVFLNQKSDLLARDLSQIYLSKLGTEIKRQDISADQLKQNVSKLMQLTVAAAQKATAVNPSDPANWSVKGHIYQNMVSLYIGFDEESIKSFDEAIKLDPTNPYYLVQQGIVMARSASQLGEGQKVDKEKKLADAEEKFNSALKLKPDYALAMFQLFVVYQAQGKTSEAVEQIRKAEKAAPFDAGLPFQLGIFYYGRRDYDNARQEFERAIGIDAKYSNALYFLGLTYDKLGDRAKALEMIEKVASFNPDNEEIKKVLDNIRNGRAALDGLQGSDAAPISEAPDEINPAPAP